MTTTAMAARSRLALAGCIGVALAGGAGQVQAQASTSVAESAARLERLEQQVDAQLDQLRSMQQELAEHKATVAELQRALNNARLDAMRGRGDQNAAQNTETPVAAAAPVMPAQTPGRSPVGQAPAPETRPPNVAQIFDQPGVLTPGGAFVIEPSVQLGYSANDRVALVGYTIIPALLIGLIDVRQVKTTSTTAALTARYGLTPRLELEARVPYVSISGDTVSREIFTGTAVDNVFKADGQGIGDVELTARYQFNNGGMDRPFYIGWLRYKTRTGKDLFHVVTDCIQRCVGNTTGTGLPIELPTGSGFAAVQPGVTWLYVSDPAVFFGSFSYLYNFPRENVSRTVIGGGKEFIGEVEPGGIFGFNVGMGLALNEKASISLGYDQSFVGETKQNGEDVPGSVRVILGTLLVGASYRFSDRVALNLSLGIGVTRDTPDVTLTARVPIAF